jgi:Tol biopolymer transport system component
VRRAISTVAVFGTVVATSLAASAAGPPAQITFARGLGRIWVMSADGRHQRQLTSRLTFSPRWSPDRRWIAFTAAGRGEPSDSQEIWLMRSDGSHQRQLTRLYPAQAIGLSWSPDGTQLAYARSVKPPGGIWVINIDGSGSTAITNDRVDSFPAWAPDGRHLLLTKACCTASGPQWKGPSTIYEVNANGTGEHRLLKPPANGCNDDDPSWSPDSSWIVFDRCVNVGPPPAGDGPTHQRTDLWLVRANRTGLHLLLRGGGSPSWSPDDQWIVFVGSAAAGKGGFDSLYKVHPTGHDTVRLTRDPRGDASPDW